MKNPYRTKKCHDLANKRAAKKIKRNRRKQTDNFMPKMYYKGSKYKQQFTKLATRKPPRHWVILCALEWVSRS